MATNFLLFENSNWTMNFLVVLKNPDLLKQQGQHFLLQDKLTRAVSILAEFETHEHFGKNKIKIFFVWIIFLA